MKTVITTEPSWPTAIMAIKEITEMVTLVAMMKLMATVADCGSGDMLDIKNSLKVIN